MFVMDSETPMKEQQLDSLKLLLLLELTAELKVALKVLLHWRLPLILISILSEKSFVKEQEIF